MKLSDLPHGTHFRLLGIPELKATVERHGEMGTQVVYHRARAVDFYDADGVGHHFTRQERLIISGGTEVEAL